MRKLFLLICSLALALTTSAQQDCTGGRYYDDVFQNVTVTSGITYGQNTDVSGTLQTLKLDIYEATGDTDRHRPLLLLAFGGSFVAGFRTSPDIVQLCNAFARKGYVCASIDYRLGLSPGIIPVVNAVNVRKAILRATHDMRAAVRYMKMKGDSLGIDTSRIIVGGVSAGGFAALHTAYMDELSEITSIIDTTGIEGEVEGNSGNAGYSSRPWAVVNLCGALLDTTWIHAGDIPVVTMQGNLDGSVPYCHDVEKVFGTPITGLIVAGGNPLERRVWNLGIPTGFYTWWGADHTPFILGTNTAAYMDTTIRYIRDFLSSQLCATAFSYSRDSLTENYCGTFTSVDDVASSEVLVYPNPSNGEIEVQLGRNDEWVVEMYDLSGRVVQSKTQTGSRIKLEQHTAGVYFLRVTGNEQTKVQRVIIE
jgi:para-nitrobenzyl esterase